jgi:hypothetical protein
LHTKFAVFAVLLACVVFAGCGSGKPSLSASKESTGGNIVVPTTSAKKSKQATSSPNSKSYPFKLKVKSSSSHPNVVTVRVTNISDSTAGPFLVELNGGPRGEKPALPLSVEANDKVKSFPGSTGQVIKVNSLRAADVYVVVVTYASGPACEYVGAQLSKQPKLGRGLADNCIPS